MIMNNKENLRFFMFFMISFVINTVMVFLVPSCTKTVKNEELKYERIETGLISIAETNKKEFKSDNNAETLNTVEKISKETVKSEISEAVSPLENKNKTAGTENVVKNNNLVSKPKFSGPSREDNGVEGLVTTTTSTKALREKNDGILSNKTSGTGEKSTNLKGSEIKGLDVQSKNLKGGTKILETGNFSQNSVGLDLKNEGTKNNDTEISIKDTGINNSIPKNISYSSVDVTGGRVVFRKYTAPIYPEEAQANAWNGDVEVEFIVRDGKTTFSGITGKSGYSVIDRAVEKAARNWLLSIEKNGLAVNGKVRVKVEFDF